MQRNRVSQDRERTGKDTRRADASDGSTDDENNTALGDGTYEASELEYSDDGEEGPLDGPEGIHSPHEELEGGTCEHVRGAIPSNIGETMELVGNFGDRSSDD